MLNVSTIVLNQGIVENLLNYAVVYTSHRTRELRMVPALKYST